LNRRTLPARRSALRSLMLALLGLAAATTSAEAGSNKAAFAVSATVIANCATRGQTTVCTKGIASPRAAVNVETSESTAVTRGHPSTSQTDPTRTSVLTINF
jgi:hypothetical protein